MVLDEFPDYKTYYDVSEAVDNYLLDPRSIDGMYTREDLFLVSIFVGGGCSDEMCKEYREFWNNAEYLSYDEDFESWIEEYGKQ